MEKETLIDNNSTKISFEDGPNDTLSIYIRDNKNDENIIHLNLSHKKATRLKEIIKKYLEE